MGMKMTDADFFLAGGVWLRGEVWLQVRIQCGDGHDLTKLMAPAFARSLGIMLIEQANAANERMGEIAKVNGLVDLTAAPDFTARLREREKKNA
jgi:hypothetical protein